MLSWERRRQTLSIQTHTPVPRACHTRLSQRADGAAFGFGIFAADQIKLNEYFELVGGVRWDYFDNDFEGSRIIP